MIENFWTLRRVSAALGIRGHDDRPLRSVSTDTRSVQPGDVFVALRGERFDAHDFLRDAVASGAGALVVADGANAAGLGVPTLVVDDTLVALGALARYHRDAWARPVIAVGGSNGKTTTKELVRAALGATLNVHATSGNLNNRIGVPHTLLTLTELADIAVVEVGTNEPGEIALLRDMVKPDIAIITTVQEEHLEGFGDLAGVMREEMSLCDGVALAIVPAAEPAVVAEARARAARVITVGNRQENADVRPSAWGVGADGRGWLATPRGAGHGSQGGEGEGEGEELRCVLPIAGAHNVANAMLAVAAARVCGVADADALRGLASATFPPMRSAVRPLGEAMLINDAYNANPASMRAGIELLKAVGAGGAARPLVAVLGTMREMGEHAASLHDEIARFALAQPLAVIGAVGEFVTAFARVAPNDPRVVGAPDPDALWPVLAPRLDRHAAILLKASRGVRLERLLPALEAWAGVANDAGQPS